MPFGTPVPPSPDTSAALLAAFAERGIEFVADRRVRSLDPARRVAVLDDGTELPYDLFLGVPKHRAPEVVLEAGWPWTATSPSTREPSRPASRTSTPSATSRPSACPRRACSRRGKRASSPRALVARRRGTEPPAAYDGRGACYVEFGAGRVGRVDVDFLSGPRPTGTFLEPSEDLVAEKSRFGASRRSRWFNG